MGHLSSNRLIRKGKPSDSGAKGPGNRVRSYINRKGKPGRSPETRKGGWQPPSPSGGLETVRKAVCAETPRHSRRSQRQNEPEGRPGEQRPRPELPGDRLNRKVRPIGSPERVALRQDSLGISALLVTPPSRLLVRSSGGRRPGRRHVRSRCRLSSRCLRSVAGALWPVPRRGVARRRTASCGT